MYTILVKEDNTLVTSIRERIMQRSKLVDNLHFLVDPIYKGIDMSDFMVTLEYILPVSREYKTETLIKSDEIYKEKLEYKLPLDTALTKEAGEIEVQLTFTKVTLNPDGSNTQQVRKTSATTITILPITSWSNVIPDSALSALDQRIIATQAMLEAANEMANYLDETKADNIVYDNETQSLRLTAHGKPIGNSVTIGYTGVSVVAIEVDENGDMVINYSDGKSENIGKVGGCDNCPGGVYIPSYSENGILTFTRKDKIEEEIYEFDIDKSNDWIPIEGNMSESSYIWEEL